MFTLWYSQCHRSRQCIIARGVTSAVKRHFSPWVKFNWNASNRIKDFWNATRLPFQSKHYAPGELCYCSTPFIHQWAALALTPFWRHPEPPFLSHHCKTQSLNCCDDWLGFKTRPSESCSSLSCQKSNRLPFRSDIFHQASNHSEFLDRQGCGR